MDFTSTQLHDKIRRLKKKYENNKSKEKGKEMSFAKLHEQSAYDLSKQIWGNEAGKENGAEKVANGSVARKTAEKKANVVEGVKNAVVALPTKRAVNSNSGVEEKALINGGEKSEVGQDAEGENEWEKLKREELQLYLKQLELRIAQTELVLNAMKGGDE